MKRFVVDASVLIKLFFDEEHTEAAAKHMIDSKEVFAPDLIWAESANVIWKRFRAGNISAEDAAGIADQMLLVPIQTQPTMDLVPDALDIAIQTQRTVYDCLYLAQAVRNKCPLLTADERLVNALADTPLARHIRFVADKM